LNVHGQENAEIFEPKTPRNMAPMSEDAHLGHSSLEAVPATSPNNTPSPDTNEPRTLFAQATPAVETRNADVTIKMLQGSGIWKKGPMQTFGPKTVTIKAGQSVTFKNVDVGMAHSVF